jgi:hypothetical protein
MDLQQRLLLLERLGDYIVSDDVEWQATKEKAHYQNKWFIPDFINLQASNIGNIYLSKTNLADWASRYKVPQQVTNPKNVGIVMAGNIPMVGFHDFLSVFVSGHKQTIKLSSKDIVLTRHLIEKLMQWNDEVKEVVSFNDLIKSADAYIATGSNNTSRYFEYYFSRYPHIIRRNRTSVAILTGDETAEELSALADDVYQFFGLGCRNVTKLYVPREYDFVPLLETFKKYNFLFDHSKYKNNYDYQLAILIINKRYYMTNGSIILLEEPSIFSPISQLNYEYYDDKNELTKRLQSDANIQCIVGNKYVHFGKAQRPGLCDYADGIDTMKFLMSL